MTDCRNHASGKASGWPCAASVFSEAIKVLQADYLRIEGIVLGNGGWRCAHCEAAQAPGETRYSRYGDYLCRQCFREFQRVAQRRRNKT